MSGREVADERIFVLRRDNEILRDLRDTRDVRVLVDMVFWNFWSRQLFPYKSVTEGQTLYWVDLDERVIAAELRVSGVVPVEYDDANEPYRVLRTLFGIDKDLADTALNGRDLPVPGYLLVVAGDPVALVDVPFDIDWGKVGGQPGWAAWETVLGSPRVSAADKEVLRGLPPPGRPPMARGTPIDLGAYSALPTTIPRPPRRPPAWAVREVTQRAGGTCEMAGCTAPAEHLDHIYPWAHGGSNEPENLQWLCARHNLEKADRIPEKFTAKQVWIEYRAERGGTVRIGRDLRALEVRTRNSVYDIVGDSTLVLCWKRGTRIVFVDEDRGIESIFERRGIRRVIRVGRGSEPLHTTTPVRKVKKGIDPVETLARIGRKPGDRIPLTKI